jgi:hypothetical protein
MGDHDGLESVITIGWNAQAIAAHAEAGAGSEGRLLLNGVRPVLIISSSSAGALQSKITALRHAKSTTWPAQEWYFKGKRWKRVGRLIGLCSRTVWVVV